MRYKLLRADNSLKHLRKKVTWHVILSFKNNFILLSLLETGPSHMFTPSIWNYPHCMHWAIAQKEFKLTPSCLSCSLLAGIFGQRLEDTVQYERKYGQRLAPLLVEQCVDFIRERGLTEEGLFRMPGQANLVKDLQDSFDCGEKPLFDRWVDITKYRLVCLWHVKSGRNSLAVAILVYTFFPHHHSLQVLLGLSPAWCWVLRPSFS